MEHQHEHHHATHSLTLRFKYHPDHVKEHLKKVIAVMHEVKMINVRCFKLNNMDYQFWFAYAKTPLETFLADSQKVKDALTNFQGNVFPTHNAQYGSCGADSASAIMQNWPCDLYADEVELPTPNHHWHMAPANPIIYCKMQVSLHPDEAKPVLKEWKEIVEGSLGIQDLRTYQINCQEYLFIYSFPGKTVDEYRRISDAAKDFLKRHEKEVSIADVQIFGDLPAAILGPAMQDWHPSVVAAEVNV
jgi:hypothetical protein